MKKRLHKLLLVLMLSSNLQADIQEAGDIVQILVPLGALAGTYIADDSEGRMMFAKGFALNVATVHTTKFLVDKWRPKAQNPDSFPSGHTAAAFGGAAFVQTRYGYAYGVPAFALASFVGYTRIESEWHYSDDVLAGASLALVSNWAFAEPLVDDIRVSVEPINDGVKISANIPIGETQQKKTPTIDIQTKEFKPDVRFIFEFGAAWMMKNDIASQHNSSNVIDMEIYGATADPTTSIRSGFEFYLNDANEVLAQFSPYTIRAVGTLNSAINFDGVGFNTTEETLIAYKWDAYKLRWRYNFLDNNIFVVKAGLGVVLSRVVTELSTDTKAEKVAVTTVLPIAHLHLGVNINDSELYTEVDGGRIEDECTLDAALMYRYKISKHWDVGGGYRFERVVVDDSQLYNEFISHNVVMNLGYAFLY